MSIIKSSLFLVSSTVVRALNGLAVLKILALHSSPAGFGYLSQVMGVIGLFGMLSAGGIGNGLTRQLAASAQPGEWQRWMVAGLKIYLAASLALALVLVAASLTWSRWFAGDSGYAVVFICLAAGQALVGAASLAQSVASARQDYAFTLRIALIGALGGAVAVAIGVWSAGVTGGAIALVVNAAFPGIAAIVLKRRGVRRLAECVGEKVRRADIVLLVKYACVSLTGAASLAISQIASRNLVGESAGWMAVGLWQTVARISDVYMQLISVVLMAYVLPRLSRHAGFRIMHAEFMKFCAMIAGTFCVAALAIYALRDLIITLLFSREYLPAAALLDYQLAGDLFRIVAVCISVALMARGLTKLSIFYEATQGILMFLLTFTLLGHSAGAAPVQAYCITYAALLLVLAYAYRRQLACENRS